MEGSKMVKRREYSNELYFRSSEFDIRKHDVSRKKSVLSKQRCSNLDPHLILLSSSSSSPFDFSCTSPGVPIPIHSSPWIPR